MDFTNRLTGNNSYPSGTFFFGYDYWTYDGESDVIELDGELFTALKSVTTGEAMPEQLARRLYDL